MSTPHTIVGPLHGVKVIEFAGLAPTPFAGLILADYGAEVVRVDIPSPTPKPTADILTRNKKSIAIDAKHPKGRQLLLRLIERADVVLDPFRPGALEKLGLGPDVFLELNQKGALQPAKNERLIFARIAGADLRKVCVLCHLVRRGLDNFIKGPYRQMVGHDINYLALSGVLSMMPGTEKPSFPLNLLSDFAGGGLICVMGILMALFARNTSSKGQVVDVDMVSGARYLATFPLIHSMIPGNPLFGRVVEDGGRGRSTGLLDGGAPFYDVYTCKDGRWISVGCLEPHFFKAFIQGFVVALPRTFLEKAGWVPDASSHSKQEEWSRLRAFMAQGFMSKTRDEWSEIFANSDACVAPVLSPSEAGHLSVSPTPQPHPILAGSETVFGSALPLIPGQHSEEILRSAGCSKQEIEMLWRSGALGKQHQAKL